jgi:hypothetical protein
MPRSCAALKKSNERASELLTPKGFCRWRDADYSLPSDAVISSLSPLSLFTVAGGTEAEVLQWMKSNVPSGVL